MKRVILLFVAVTCFAVPSKCQFVTRDTVSPSSGCHSPFTYDDGINLSVSVIANTTQSSAELEQIIAKDISRFKGTGHISSASTGAALPAGQRPIEFNATIFWTELQVGGKTSAYAAAAFFIETCATFGQDYAGGFSTHLLVVDRLTVQATKEKMLDDLEKNLYDALVAEVKRRRESAKVSQVRPLSNAPCLSLEAALCSRTDCRTDLRI